MKLSSIGYQLKRDRPFDWGSISGLFARKMSRFPLDHAIWDIADDTGRATFVESFESILNKAQHDRALGPGLRPARRRAEAQKRCKDAQMKAFRCGSSLQSTSQVGDNRPGTPAPPSSMLKGTASKNDRRSGSAFTANSRDSRRSTNATEVRQSQTSIRAARQSRRRLSAKRALTRSELPVINPSDSFTCDDIHEVSVASLIRSVYGLPADCEFISVLSL